MRKRVKIDHFDDLMQCTPKTFLTTFASNERLRKIAKPVTKSLKSQGLLNEDGWIPLRAEETEDPKDKKPRNENEAFAFLGKVAKAIVNAVDGYDSTLKPRAEAQPSPCATTCHTKPGYRFFPDWRTVVSSSITVEPKPPRRAKHVSDRVDTSDLVTIGEFKLQKNSATICDVRSLTLAATYCLDQWNRMKRN